MYLEVGQGPLLTGGGQVEATHKIGPYKAVLISDPLSMGPIKYKFVLIVISVDSNRPVLYVTAEWNEMLQDAEWEAIRREALASCDALLADSEREVFEGDKAMGHEQSGAENGDAESKDQGDYVLGVFSLEGRSNLGTSEDWADKEKFECKALEIAKEYLAIK